MLIMFDTKKRAKTDTNLFPAAACAGAGGGAGGVPFEVWCRYYHPNVRDQVIAKVRAHVA